MEQATLRESAEAERAEWESLAIEYQRDLDRAATEHKVVETVAITAAQAPAEQEKTGEDLRHPSTPPAYRATF